MARMNLPCRAFYLTEIHTWFERDRSHVDLCDKATQDTILEFWDESVSEEIEMGFLDPRDYHGSMLETAIERGIYTIPDEIDEYEEDFDDMEVAGAI